ncbi:MAG: spheroidene monooxygenase [Pseudomonadota bacterium]
MSAQIVTLSFFRFRGWREKLWAFAQMGLARRAIRGLPGLGFFKLMGGGTGEGFTPVPDTGLVAILTTWPDLEAAEAAVRRSDVFGRYRARAAEHWHVHLATTSARGAWSRKVPFHGVADSGAGPIAALTRATIRPVILLKFWRRVPNISAAIGADENVIFKQGVGEVPWLHQVTFSIWPDAESMARFARADGPHARAIKAVREGDWFSEELYARFRVVASEGSWGGVDPLAAYRLTLAAE